LKLDQVLHTYFRSSASYRVRIALNLKGIEARHVCVHLNRNGGEQFGAEFTALNPQALVPVFSEGGAHIGQSLAIMEYLEEKYPRPPLLPVSLDDRAFVRQVASSIACDIHPLNNLRVLKYLTNPLALSNEAKNAWARHWIELGLDALEAMLSRSTRTGVFCFGDAPTMADCCLVPQMFSARRFELDLSHFPKLLAIDAACQTLPAFAQAHPSRQSDSE
jgi:maleylpyruvate isomerase